MVNTYTSHGSGVVGDCGYKPARRTAKHGRADNGINVQ
jgi:hypothetical protein